MKSTFTTENGRVLTVVEYPDHTELLMDDHPFMVGATKVWKKGFIVFVAMKDRIWQVWLRLPEEIASYHPWVDPMHDG